MLPLLALLLLASCTLAQVPQPCTSPQQWEGHLRKFEEKQQRMFMAKLTYDAIERRVREIEEVDEASTRDFYDVISLHNVGLEYRLNLKTRQCNVTTLSRPFMPVGVLPGATFRYSGVLGVAGEPDQSVTVQMWEGDFEGNPFFAEVTSPGCLPVRSRYTSTSTGTIESLSYDIVLGLPDPSVFDPPPECQRSSR